MKTVASATFPGTTPGSTRHAASRGRVVQFARLALGLLFLLGGTVPVGAAPNVTNATQKGSALIFPDIRVDRDGADWNTLIRVQNDGSLDVSVTCYWMDGNKNRVDFGLVITRNQAVWFDARTGQGTHQVNPFPTSLANGFDNPFLLTPPSLDEAADGPGLYFKGTLVCWATDAGRQTQVKWNHLSGTATLYHPQVGAYEYDAYAFFAPSGLDQEPVGTAGTLTLDGVFYDTCPLYQIGQFSPAPVCGNGIIVGTETCDDGNLANGDGCSAACAVEAGFACAGAPSVCTTTCGDGIQAGAETCDDGNTAGGDGCSALCTPEPGFACVGTTPSVCAPVCGDGLVTGGEACDDGNTTSGDGCSSVCAIEPQPNGATCATSLQCGSGLCVDGVCCNSTCAGTCQSCSLAGSVGTCSPAPVSTDPDNECTASDPGTCGTTGFCDGAGACQLYPANTPTPAQTTGDCHSNVCTGTGSTTTSIDDTDVPVDGNQCTLDVCSAGVPSNPNAPAGTVCNQNGGNLCDGSGNCVQGQRCSDVAISWCLAKGWTVSPWPTAFPNAPGGTIFCTAPGVSASSDCDSCATYNQLVWAGGAKDACSSTMGLIPGRVYGGHSPCSCQPNNLDCGTWDMQGCIPD